MIRVKTKFLGRNVQSPVYKTDGASGFDLEACLDGEITVNPLESILIPTGLSFEIPQGYEMQIRSRSGLALHNGIVVLNSPGTIDSDYRGEIKIILFNTGSKPFVVHNKDRVAQGVLCRVEKCDFVLADSFTETKRQDGGFGSTQV